MQIRILFVVWSLYIAGFQRYQSHNQNYAMKKIFLIGIVFIVYSICAVAQNVVLVEQFTETGCGACSQYDSAFNAITNRNADKVAVINYHCFYVLDTFNLFNKGGSDRNNFYSFNQGFPSAAVNGKMPRPNYAHVAYVNEQVITDQFNRPPQFNFEIVCTPAAKGSVHQATINIKATALKYIPVKDLRLFVAVTENNINYEQRYHTKSVNGINEFQHIFRAMLPDMNGTLIGSQSNGQKNKVKLTFTNDDREMNYKEVRLVVFVQDYETKEVLGSAVMKDNPFLGAGK